MSSNQYELRTPLQFKQPFVGRSRKGTAEGLNHQVEFYYGLDTWALLGAALRMRRRMQRRRYDRLDNSGR